MISARSAVASPLQRSTSVPRASTSAITAACRDQATVSTEKTCSTLLVHSQRIQLIQQCIISVVWNISSLKEPPLSRASHLCSGPDLQQWQQPALMYSIMLGCTAGAAAKPAVGLAAWTDQACIAIPCSQLCARTPSAYSSCAAAQHAQDCEPCLDACTLVHSHAAYCLPSPAV